MSSSIRTQILILSDTHGKDFAVDHLPTCDVAIHCGDLTDGSKLEEFQTTIHNPSLIDAPLKLVIAGNHDFTMDLLAFRKKIADATQSLEPKLVAREYGVPGQVRKLFEDIKVSGIVYLDEGMHQFTLINGARLSVYASPHTPLMGQWGFRYHPDKGHDFSLSEDIDIAITHGPPRGIMDYTYGKERAGCPNLFAANANARLRVHCFGHIYEAIDNERPPMIKKLAGLRAGRFDSEEDVNVERMKLERLSKDKCFRANCCTGGEYEIERGKQMLFVNASIEESEDLEQRPWLVKIDLPEVDSMEGGRLGDGAHDNSTVQKKAANRAS